MFKTTMHRKNNYNKNIMKIVITNTKCGSVKWKSSLKHRKNGQ